MDPQRWQRVESVLDRVLLADRSTWSTLLDDCCGADHELRAEVETLLARLPRAAEFLASPPSATASALIEGRRNGDGERRTDSLDRGDGDSSLRSE